MGHKKRKKILQRLFELSAADTLADVTHLPPARCHALTGDLAGKFAVNTVNPYRIIFEPANEPIPYLDDNSIDRSQVTAFRILDVNKDYHG